MLNCLRDEFYPKEEVGRKEWEEKGTRMLLCFLSNGHPPLAMLVRVHLGNRIIQEFEVTSV